MRFTTSGKWKMQVRVLETTLHLDCGHQLVYEGEPSTAELQLKMRGGTIASNGVTRCKPCAVEHTCRLFDALRASQ